MASYEDEGKIEQAVEVTSVDGAYSHDDGEAKIEKAAVRGGNGNPEKAHGAAGHVDTLHLRQSQQPEGWTGRGEGEICEAATAATATTAAAPTDSPDAAAGKAEVARLDELQAID